MSALTSLYPLFQMQLDKFLTEFEKLSTDPAETGVGVEGPGAAYALVWEFGNARQTKPGPKTTMGTNPDGKRVWLSIQAPHGYIRVNTPLYWAALEQEMNKVDLSGSSPDEIQTTFEQAALRIANRIRDIIKEHVPVDTGELQGDIRTIGIGDSLLDESDDDAALVLVQE